MIHSFYLWVLVMLTALLLTPLTSQASKLPCTIDNGISCASPEENFTIQAGGRLHLDGAVFSEDKTSLENDWIVRRARLSLRIDWLDHWRLSAQYDLADTDEKFRSLWLRYAGFDNTRITIGQFQEPFSLEESSSSNNISFMERSLANALVAGTNVGIGVHHWGDNWGAELGLFWATYIEDSDPLAREDGYGFSSRFTVAAIKKKRNLLHLGFSLAYHHPREDNRIRIRTQPESDVTNERFISTGRMRNVDRNLTTGIELAIAGDSLLIQGEYILTHLNRFGDRSDEVFDGGYLSASWVFNNRQRRYSSRSGIFGRVNPQKNHVWEVALRYSFLNLNSYSFLGLNKYAGSVTGGDQVNTSLAVNWYLNDKVRLMLNYIQVNTDAEAGDDDPRILQLRLQIVI